VLSPQGIWLVRIGDRKIPGEAEVCQPPHPLSLKCSLQTRERHQGRVFESCQKWCTQTDGANTAHLTSVHNRRVTSREYFDENLLFPYPLFPRLESGPGKRRRHYCAHAGSSLSVGQNCTFIVLCFPLSHPIQFQLKLPPTYMSGSNLYGYLFRFASLVCYPV
jgi:hypothetical protein